MGELSDLQQRNAAAKKAWDELQAALVAHDEKCKAEVAKVPVLEERLSKAASDVVRAKEIAAKFKDKLIEALNRVHELEQFIGGGLEDDG